MTRRELLTLLPVSSLALSASSAYAEEDVLTFRQTYQRMKWDIAQK